VALPDGQESGRHEPADRVLDAAPRQAGRGLERGELGPNLGVPLAVPTQDEQDDRVGHPDLERAHDPMDVAEPDVGRADRGHVARPQITP
jgi:hypothetical protein